VLPTFTEVGSTLFVLISELVLLFIIPYGTTTGVTDFTITGIITQINLVGKVASINACDGSRSQEAVEVYLLAENLGRNILLLHSLIYY